MINTLVNFSEPSWDMHEFSSEHRFFLKGHPFFGSQQVSITALATQIANRKDITSLTEFLNQLNGFFSWVEFSTDGIRASVDHVRSIPLFYATHKDSFFIGDSANWVKDQVGDDFIDPVAYEEFLLAGYVTGSDTLFANVKQIQAGELLTAKDRNSQKISLTTHRFYRFFHNEPEKFQEASLREELDNVAEKSISRLIQFADGRPIVVPLSGGYDSRLIVTLLKKLKYENVLTFSYGVPGNREAEFSRKTANSLGFKWVFEKYDADLWRTAWRTDEADQYRKTASNHTSLPHIQDWLAIKQLIAHEEIKPDSILVPGHSGDFVAGSHVPASVFSGKSFDESDLVNAVAKTHLQNAPRSELKVLNADLIHKRIMDRINLVFDGSAIQFANLFELWDWQERQSKYIVNSCRVYDQFNLAWWLPLWDLEFVKFWERVPLALRQERKWYKAWVTDLFRSEINRCKPKFNLKNASDPLPGKSLMKKLFFLLPQWSQDSIRAKWLSRALHNHFLAFEGLINDAELDSLLIRQFNLIGIYSKLFLEGRW